MAEEHDKEKEMADTARADAEKRADEQFDQLLKGIDSVKSAIDAANARMDALERSDEDEDDKDEDEHERHHENEDDKDEDEARRMAADKRKDAARADAAEARADAVAKDLEATRKELAALAELVRKPFSDDHRKELTTAQARADAVLQQFGDEAPRPLVGETPRTYRSRIVGMLQMHSDKWKGIRLDGFDDDAFKVVEDQVYADAVSAARRPRDLKAGQMREITERSPTGHITTRFVGTESFVTGFRRPLRRVSRFAVPN